jgi:hypothetical protein
MVNIKPGDIFLLEGTGWLDRFINFFQALWNGDGKSNYTHSGIILDEYGTTFETTEWKTKCLNLFSDHPGSEVIIFRWKNMTQPAFAQGCLNVGDQLGKIYPYFRLLLFATHIAKWFHWKKTVCSELVAKFLVGARARGSWWGINVDLLHDDCMAGDDWVLIYSGKPREMK